MTTATEASTISLYKIFGWLAVPGILHRCKGWGINASAQEIVRAAVERKRKEEGREGRGYSSCPPKAFLVRKEKNEGMGQ